MFGRILLERYRQAGIRRIVALRGDPTGGVGVAGFDNPTSLALGPAAHLFVATQLGKIYVLTLNPQTLSSPTMMPELKCA